MAWSLNVSDKGSKLDIINRIKAVLNIEEKFLKLFSKMWGGLTNDCIPAPNSCDVLLSTSYSVQSEVSTPTRKMVYLRMCFQFTGKFQIQSS